jgi:hypothetical protein
MMKTTWIVCLLLLVQAQIGYAQTATGAQVSKGREQRHATYVQLSRQIFARHEDPDSERLHVSAPERVAEIRSQLRKLISDEIDTDLNGPNVSASDLKNAIASIQGEMRSHSKYSGVPRVL